MDGQQAYITESVSVFEYRTLSFAGSVQLRVLYSDGQQDFRVSVNGISLPRDAGYLRSLACNTCTLLLCHIAFSKAMVMSGYISCRLMKLSSSVHPACIVRPAFIDFRQESFPVLYWAAADHPRKLCTLISWRKWLPDTNFYEDWVQRREAALRLCYTLSEKLPLVCWIWPAGHSLKVPDLDPDLTGCVTGCVTGYWLC